jgi:Protein of unknown function (DUF3611)
MTNEFENQPTPPPNLKQVAQTFRLTGWISLWAQLVLAIISGVIYIFAGVAAAMGRSAAGNNATNPATGGGVLFAIVSLMILFYGIYQSFQCVQTGRRLRDSNPSLRPKKTDTVNFLWRSLTIRGSGLLFAVIAAEAIAGVLLGKSFMAVGAVFSPGAQLQIVQPLDIFLVLANTHLLTAHFIGVSATLWLLNRIDR